MTKEYIKVYGINNKSEWLVRYDKRNLGAINKDLRLRDEWQNYNNWEGCFGLLNFNYAPLVSCIWKIRLKNEQITT